jgi:hypothetical protein
MKNKSLERLEDIAVAILAAAIICIVIFEL